MRDTARKWTRPYTSMQWAWVRALGIEPSEEWGDGARRVRRRHRGLGRLMKQRHGVRGL